MQEAKEFQLQSGDLFADRYRIERKLGQGGMGTVYLVIDTLLADEQIALKVLHQQLTQDSKQTQRFLREVQLTRKVTHPNIVRTFDVGMFSGRLFYTMEYTDGMSLEEVLKSGALPADTVINILHGIFEGLAGIHVAEITHRDLKPGNVILTPQGVVKIADFGIAKPQSSELTGHDEVVGSTRYMAPEMWTGQNIGPWSDIYSLGVLAYYMLTGILPFEGDTSAELMFKHLESRPVPPDELDNSIPGWLSAMVMGMLEKQSDKRKSVTELLAELDHRQTEAVNNHSEPSPSDHQLSPRQRALLDSTFMETTPFEDSELVVEGPADPADTFAGRIPHPASLFEEPPPELQQADSAPVAQVTEATTGTRAAERWSGLLWAPLALVCGGALLYGLVTVGADLLEAVWQRLTLGKASERLNLFIGLLPSVLFFSFIAAVPVFSLALVRQCKRRSLEFWCRAAAGVALLICALFFYNSLRAGYKWYLVNDEFRLVSFFVGTEKTAQGTVQNVLEAAMLAPIGTFYDIKMVGGGTGIPLLSPTAVPSIIEMLPYYALLCCYLVLLVWILSRYILRVSDADFVTVAVLHPIMMGVIAAEYFLRDVISSMFVWNIHRVYLWTSSPDSFTFPIAYSFNEYAVFCGALNWAIVWIAVTVVIPRSLSRGRTAESEGQVKSSYRRSLHGSRHGSHDTSTHNTRG